MSKEFKYEIVDNFDKLIDEKGNSFISLRKLTFNDNPDVKLDLRKYYSTATGERMYKGVSFLTEDGPNELTHVLVEEGYGDTEKLVRLLAKRQGVELPEEEVNNEEYFDIRDIFDSIESEEDTDEK